eukprot:gnl/TRDRNA2_/TRDRNA2_167180_c3_seq4.p3 gnl/TRDRNA2_/TRDRNA2_167180_c3~~gnl/TRDRNA2_/TRDRNA2_167180_c3_seq4.p3  ORF type:complete len:119 (-),score=18.79 gnl/TRDRNA2_/TRDRNA2_167180_c3_seq4:59-415(-)
MISWALSQCRSLTDVWHFADSGVQHGLFVDPLLPAAMIAECEQRELKTHEVSLLKHIEQATGDDAGVSCIGVATKHAAAMRLAKMGEANLVGTDLQKDAMASFTCMWCSCTMESAFSP